MACSRADTVAVHWTVQPLTYICFAKSPNSHIQLQLQLQSARSGPAQAAIDRPLVPLNCKIPPVPDGRLSIGAARPLAVRGGGAGRGLSPASRSGGGGG